MRKTNTKVYRSGSIDGNPLIYSPPFDSAERRSNRPSAIFSLVSTIVGGGALSLPFGSYLRLPINCIQVIVVL